MYVYIYDYIVNLHTQLRVERIVKEHILSYFYSSLDFNRYTIALWYYNLSIIIYIKLHTVNTAEAQRYNNICVTFMENASRQFTISFYYSIVLIL